MIPKWDGRFLQLAEHVAGWSRDPSTKVGAVIVRPDKTIASMGFNGFPRGVKDDVERYCNKEEKYQRIIHAEINAILFLKEPAVGFTLYTWPLLPCDRCATCVIQVGITRVVSLISFEARWAASITRAKEMLTEAGVVVDVV